MRESVTESGDLLYLITAASPAGLDLRHFECLPGCSQCCSYKVSVLEEDTRRLEAAGHTREEFLDPERQPAAGFAGCLAKRDGFCVFLDSRKRCREYEHRPLYCRLYPYIRESYLQLQLDVDLSCPGIGRGRSMSEAELAGIVVREGSAVEQERRLESQRSAIRMVEKLLAHRAHLEPFDEVVYRIRSAAEAGLAGLRKFLAAEASTLSGRLLPRIGTVQVDRVTMDEDAKRLLRDYLLLWSLRQALWRWTDAVIAVTPAIGTRLKAISRFLLEMANIIEACASLAASGCNVGRENILAAIRECDSFYRRYCHSFRLEC